MDSWFCGLNEETITHFLCDCEALSNMNKRILGTKPIEKPLLKAETPENYFNFGGKLSANTRRIKVNAKRTIKEKQLKDPYINL